VSAEVAALARRFFDAIEAGDFAVVADCYADDAVIWHNTDRLDSSKAENLEVLANFVKNVIGYVGDIINRTLADCLETLHQPVG